MENERMTDKYFVWVLGLRGPEAQIWDGNPIMRDGKPIIALKSVKLHPKDDRGIDQLVKDYPHNGAEK